MEARPAGSLRPDGRRIVSLRHRGAMRTMAAERVAFALIHKQWPKGVVEFDGERLIDRPRKAKSPGRRGGLKAERARDQAALDALDGGALRLARVAEAVGGGRTNVRRRLVKLASQGLIEPPPRCCPDRGWVLTRAGREAALVDAPAPVNGHVSPWLKPVTSYVRVASAGHDGNVVRYG